MSKLLKSLVVVVLVGVSADIWVGLSQGLSGSISYVRTDSEAKRRAYLGRAKLWSEPGEITPEKVMQGPPSDWAELQSKNPDGIPCEFMRAGKDLGGKTQKFICRMPNGEAARVKYWEPPHGNREIFGDVATTRLLWALGFGADTVYPVRVVCKGCPENPFAGSGPTGTRAYLGIIEPHFEGTLILSGHNPEEGWTWREMDEAIAALPEGPERDRQRAHFDALALLGVFIQHGDRKPSQQRLVCISELNLKAGDVHPASDAEGPEWNLPVLFEKPGEYSCSQTTASIQDGGATFGGAGRFTRRVQSKMHLKDWEGKTIFRKGSSAGACKGNLTDSMSSGSAGEPNPRISEAGRAFLASLLKRLDEASIRAIFQVARVDELPEDSSYKDPETGVTYKGIDAWVKVFQQKVKEIEEASC